MEDETSSEGEKGPSEDEMDFTIHHPFELKPHTGPIVMNIPVREDIPAAVTTELSSMSVAELFIAKTSCSCDE